MNKQLTSQTIKSGDIFARATGFCSNIDQYVLKLGLNRFEIDLLKNDIAVYLEILELPDLYPAPFIEWNRKIIQERFKTLAAEAVQSRHYNYAIGAALGIEKPLSLTNRLKNFFSTIKAKLTPSINTGSTMDYAGPFNLPDHSL